MRPPYIMIIIRLAPCPLESPLIVLCCCAFCQKCDHSVPSFELHLLSLERGSAGVMCYRMKVFKKGVGCVVKCKNVRGSTCGLSVSLVFHGQYIQVLSGMPSCEGWKTTMARGGGTKRRKKKKKKRRRINQCSRFASL